MREAKLERNTNETQISLEINLDGTGKAEIQTGIGFFDHMLELFSRHGGFDLTVAAQGDHVFRHCGQFSNSGGQQFNFLFKRHVVVLVIGG